MDVPNNKPSKYVRQELIELQREIDELVHYCSWVSQHSSIKKWTDLSRQKISEDIFELNSTINQPDMIDIYRLFHPKTTRIHIFLKNKDSIIQKFQSSF